MRLRQLGAVALTATLLLGGCTSRPSLPAGLVSRAYVIHLPTMAGTARVLAKLVATEGAPADVTGVHLCRWPSGCREPYTLLWLREQLGSYPAEAGLGTAPPKWVVDAIDARSGQRMGSGADLGQGTSGSRLFNQAEDLASSQ